MVRRAFTWILCFAMIEAAFCADVLAIQPARVPRPTQSVSGLVAKLGSGADALIAVRLRDKSVVSGFVAEAGPESFVVVDPKTGEQQTVAYNDVNRLAGVNLATGVQVNNRGGVRSKLARLATLVIPGKRVPSNSLMSRTTLLIIGIVIGVLIAIVVAKTV